MSYTPDTPPEERPNWDKVEVAGGTPTIRLLLGDRERRTLARTASYVGGSGTNTLVFEYEVTAGDGRVGAVEVEADSLASNGATIRNDRGYDAELGHLSAVRYAQRPVLSVADAEATEGEDATLDFVVRLDGNSGSEGEGGLPHGRWDGGGGIRLHGDERQADLPPGRVREDGVGADQGRCSGGRRGDVHAVVEQRLRRRRRERQLRGGGHDSERRDRGAVRGADGELEGMPAEHRGEGGFHFRVALSEDIGISFKALREDAFAVTGGRVTGGGRVDGRRDLFKMTVEPDSTRT